MTRLPRPGCLVRSTLALLGVMFLPLGLWFIRDSQHRYWIHSIGLFCAAIVCFYASFKRNSLLSALDDAG